MDIIWLFKNSQGALTRIITIILLISKASSRPWSSPNLR
jgi:hypothetical protein